MQIGPDSTLADSSAHAGSTAHERCLVAILRMSGLRPTRQRVSLLRMVMDGPDRHFTIDDLFNDAREAGEPLSLATVYNATRQFSSVGIIRELAVDGTRTFFDTNTRNHQHYFLEEEQQLLDAPSNGKAIPSGMSVRRVDVLIHLARTNRS